MKECFDEGVLQAYCDSELPSERMAAVAGHLRGCEGCRSFVSAIEFENTLIDDAFQSITFHPIESERLRAGINAAIAEQAIGRRDNVRPTGWFADMRQSLSAWFTVRVAVASVALLLAIGLSAVVAIKAFNTQTPQSIARVDEAGKMSRIANAPNQKLLVSSVSAPNSVESKRAGSGGTTMRRTTPRRPEPRISAAEQVAQLEKIPLPAEEGYLKAIASLNGALKAGGENSIRPNVRATYEQNLAIVDRSIDATRETARRNPQNKDATAFLYSAYQSKLDLLNAVADQSLIASR